MVAREQLVAAFAKWTSDKSSGIDQLLVSEGVISRQRCDVLKQLDEIHVQEHNGDPLQGLRVLASSDLPAVKADLQQIDDSDLAQSIAQLPEDDHATVSRTVGQITSEADSFRILSPLVGGGAWVSVAKDEELGRHVALNQIRADLAAYRRKFQVEAEIASNLEHLGIPGISPRDCNAHGRMITRF